MNEYLRFGSLFAKIIALVFLMLRVRPRFSKVFAAMESLSCSCWAVRATKAASYA